MIIMPELSQGAYLAWRLAAGETARTMHPCIEKEFVLIGLCRLGKWLRSKAQGENTPLRGQVLRVVSTEAQTVEEALQACAIAPDLLCHAVRVAVGKGPHRRGEEIIHRSTACKACFQRAEAIAEAAGAAEVHCVHLLAAILEQPGALITRVVTEVGVHIEALRAAVEATLVSLHDRQADAGSAVHELSAGPDHGAQHQTAPATPYLDQYGYDITREAREGKIDPIIGRREEILALVRTLHQKTKNTPVLISEPGVSRIAVVKGLAIRLARGDVVAPIRGKRIVELPMHELARATPSRSQLVHNLQQAIEEASRNPTIILFIDEMHTMVGTGSAVGDLDIASLLKPALGKGNLRCIGATTVENYRRYMEPDPFFERHCQAIVVNEPSLHEMKEILAQVRPRYEEHHMVTITPEALEAAVELCAKYMPDKHFPEKAIDLLDQACSRARISQITQLEALTTAEAMYEVTRETMAATMAQKTGIPVVRLLGPPRDKLQRQS
jgi:ATP-dependent Clp protease ATP-binding subunit ClpC